MELKSFLVFATLTWVLSSNRTFMELKYNNNKFFGLQGKF